MRLLITGVVLLACLLPAAAQAQSKAAEKIGRITPTQTTSPCIGNANSPTCATETLLACFARADRSLCEKVGADPRNGVREPGPTEYVIDRVSVIRAEDITEDLRDVEWFKAGYTLVELRRRNCAAECGDQPWEDMQVYLRPRGGAWEIVNWRGEVEEDEVPEMPEKFEPPKPQ
jgi:hypothetical protein